MPAHARRREQEDPLKHTQRKLILAGLAATSVFLAAAAQPSDAALQAKAKGISIVGIIFSLGR